MATPWRAVAAEFVATSLLLAAVVGSGVMGERLAGGNVAIALLANSLATGAALVALIATFGPISGAHMNPLVTLAETVLGRHSAPTAGLFVVAQVAGALAGVALANSMFDLPVFFASTRERHGWPLLLSEGVATFGLLAVVLGAARRHAAIVPFAVGGYITAAYWFTASTSFANPAVTIARAATDTFAGIAPAGVLPFVIAQFAGAALAVLLFRWLLAEPRPVQTVIFACVHNAGRSQMAAAFFNELADPSRARAISAGTRPAERVHAEVVDVMKEVGIDLRDARPTKLTDSLARNAHMLVTMGCGEACPAILGLQREDWPLPDPKGKAADDVRRIRDEIRMRVLDLVTRASVRRGSRQ